MATGLCCLVVLLGLAATVLAEGISTGPAGIVLGATCSNNQQCAINLAYCSNNACRCQSPYKPLTDRTCGRLLGEFCNIYADCIGVSPVECTDGVCVCPPNFTANDNKTQCNGGTTVILSLVCMLTAVTSITLL